MTGIIYKITNNINGKVYIGQTIQTLKDRWYRHCGRTGSKQELDMVIKKAIHKYGKENFTMELLEECSQEDLNEREKYYINYYDSYNKGYNSTLGGQLGSKLPQTPEDVCLKIIEDYSNGKSLRELSRIYSIDKATVKGILIRHDVSLRVTRTYKLCQKDRQDIIQEFNSGVSRKELIIKYNITKGYLSMLLNNKCRI